MGILKLAIFTAPCAVFAVLFLFLFLVLFREYRILDLVGILALKGKMKRLGYELDLACPCFYRRLDRNSPYFLNIFPPSPFRKTWTALLLQKDLGYVCYMDTSASRPSEVPEMAVELETDRIVDMYVPMETRFPQMTEELREKVSNWKHYIGRQ